MSDWKTIVQNALALKVNEDVSVAHYTRIGNLQNLIKPDGLGSAWATPVQFLNDRQELFLGIERLAQAMTQPPQASKHNKRLLTKLQESTGGIETDAFQMSFSGNIDELGQWRGYAANGMGCCLVLNSADLREIADVTGWVIYKEKDQIAFANRLKEELRGNTPLSETDVLRILVAAASFMKHQGFAVEKEFRVIKFPEKDAVKFRESGERLVPYTDILQDKRPLTILKILLGPGWQLAQADTATWNRHPLVLSLSRLLEMHDLAETTSIESSSIPYDPK
jgi:hypothetical protein